MIRFIYYLVFNYNVKEKLKDVFTDKRFLIGVSFVLISVFVWYFYLVTQTWTELPFSRCTPVESPEEYAGVFVPLELDGYLFMYSPDNGFNSCVTNIGTVIGPFVSLFTGVIILGLSLFHSKIN